jgi:uncharacterized protein YxjI
MGIRGDLLSHEFTIQRDGQTAATVPQTLAQPDRQLRGRYRPGENDLLILASVLALDLAMDQKRHAA